MAAPLIISVLITPQTVNAGQSFKIEVAAESWEQTLADIEAMTLAKLEQQPLSKLDGGA